MSIVVLFSLIGVTCYIGFAIGLGGYVIISGDFAKIAELANCQDPGMRATIFDVAWRECSTLHFCFPWWTLIRWKELIVD